MSRTVMSRTALAPRPGTTYDAGMSAGKLPPCLQRRSDREAVSEDVEPCRGTTVGERSEVMSRLCRFAAEQVAARADGQRILDYQEPRSHASMELWLRLVTSAARP
jgi:hypothetical protein